MFLFSGLISRKAFSIEASRTMFDPEVSVYHAYEKGSYKNPKLLSYHIQSVVKYFNKWGWLFDRKRREANKRCLAQFGSVKLKQSFFIS